MNATNRKKHPRILLVAPSFRIIGGQAVMADRLIRRMQADGIRIDQIPIDPLPPKFLRWAVRIKYLRTLVVSSIYVGLLLKRIARYDVIHVFSAAYLSFIIAPAPAILMSRLFRRPVVLNYHSGEAEDHLRRWKRIVIPILRRCERIVVPSEFLVQVFSSFGLKATAIPNVVDRGQIPYRRRTSVHPRIIVARALEPLYNVECALRAFAIVQKRFPHAELTILGEGSQRKSLECLAADLHLTAVKFAGRVERHEIGRFYDEHDLFLNSSSIDNMPVSILEAFAAGLPVVTTCAGGIPFIVRDRDNGHVVDVNDHRALAARIVELVENPTEVTRLSDAGESEAQRHTWSMVGWQWYQLYGDVTCRGSSGVKEESKTRIQRVLSESNPAK